jgi:hypothetical protein
MTLSPDDFTKFDPKNHTRDRDSGVFYHLPTQNADDSKEPRVKSLCYCDDVARFYPDCGVIVHSNEGYTGNNTTNIDKLFANDKSAKIEYKMIRILSCPEKFNDGQIEAIRDVANITSNDLPFSSDEIYNALVDISSDNWNPIKSCTIIINELRTKNLINDTTVYSSYQSPYVVFTIMEDMLPYFTNGIHLYNDGSEYALDELSHDVFCLYSNVIIESMYSDTKNIPNDVPCKYARTMIMNRLHY